MSENEKMVGRLAQDDAIKGKSQMREAWDRLKKQPLAMITLAGVILIFLIAITCPLFIDYDAQVVQQDVYNKIATSSAEHPFGTDYLGRDMFGRILWGTRAAILMGFGANIITCVIALILACCCAFFGGVVDLVIMRFVDVLLSMPSMVLSIAICAGLGNGLWQLVVALAAGNLGHMVQMLRSSTLTIANMEYMEAGKALGATTPYLIVKYMLPNMVSILLIVFTMHVSMNIMMGATLSFVGLGVKSPTPEWGMILSEGLSYYTVYPRLVNAPGLALIFTAFCVTTLGDCLRDAFDPKLKGKA